MMTAGGISKTWNNSNKRTKQMQSESIAALAAALSKAQADITGALKDSSNPFFKSKYADLASCWDACRKQLAANGLCVIQTTGMTDAGLVLITTLAHSSGEWMRGVLPVVTKDNGPQAQGSGITYARRYALAAIVGLAQIDDDAEAAQARPFTNNPRGDLGKTIPAAERDPVVAEFRSALGLDAEEKDIAAAIYAIHDRIKTNHDLYVAVSDCLNSKERSALKAYIKMAQEKK
jgi:hypothetical protein